MRIVLALITAGCAAGALPPPTGDGPNPADGCGLAGPEYVRAQSGRILLEQITIDGLSVFADLTPPDTCVRSDGGGAAWFLDRDGDAYGMLRLEAQQLGEQAPNANNLVIDLFGETPPVRYTGALFNGSFVLNAQRPFDATVRGDATVQGRVLLFAAEATATP